MCFQLHLMMLLQQLLLLGLLTGSAWSRASPENPLEKLAVGALSVGTGIMGSLQEGAMATQQMNFNGGLVAVRSKTAMGYGDAMRPDGGEDSDSSESDERRRRRRRNTNSTSSSSSGSYRNSSRSFSLHQALHRLKRSPCGMNMGATTESADDVEARKKRARKRAANNNASRTRISKTSTKKKLLESRRRRRRQATQQQQLGAGLGEQVKGLLLSFMDNMADMVQQVRQQVKGATAQATGGMQTI